MEITFKTRESRYCNLKLLLLFLVVYGHIIEPLIYNNLILHEIYRIIYMVHMPLFVFLSGLFLKNMKSCLNQAKKAVICYTIFQIIYLAVDFCINRKVGTLLKPYWHLWYLLSLALWSLIGAGYYSLADRWKWPGKRQMKLIIMFMAAVIGCVAGIVQEIDYTMSMSRTLVFMPYFMAGIFCPQKTEWRKYRKAGIGFFIISVFLYVIIREDISVGFLYQACSYGELGFIKGCALRSMCYLIGCAWGLWLLICVPDKRFMCSRAGADTLRIYILHAPLVMLLWKLTDYGLWYIIAAPLAAVMIMWILYKIFQWNSQIFMIRGRGLEETCRNGGI